MNTLVVCSGGLDSVTLAYKVAQENDLGGLLSFDYGQRHKKELSYAKKCADQLGVPFYMMDIAPLGKMLNGSALTDAENVHVPEGHYAEESMKLTIVPNRNAIMLSVAYGVASSKNLTRVATAVHGGDHFIYPDCRPNFINAFQDMQKHALEGVANISLYTPYIHADKTEIAKDADVLNVPIEDTWSCYNGGDIHCGRCGTCVERIEACALADINDPTHYEDQNFWRTAVKKEQQKSGVL